MRARSLAEEKKTGRITFQRSRRQFRFLQVARQKRRRGFFLLTLVAGRAGLLRATQAGKKKKLNSGVVPPFLRCSRQERSMFTTGVSEGSIGWPRRELRMSRPSFLFVCSSLLSCFLEDKSRRYEIARQRNDGGLERRVPARRVPALSGDTARSNNRATLGVPGGGGRGRRAPVITYRRPGAEAANRCSHS